MSIKTLQPQALWKHFENICSVPHPSKHEQVLALQIKGFGETLGLRTIMDELGNVLIFKPATAGNENKKTVALQAHIDMVPQKNAATKHDFTTDPIKCYVDNGWVKARDTTLGADNGIGVASILAILESKDISHGPLVALFTVDEETGMTGALGLKTGFIPAEILINTDSEDENELIIGCAGGMDLTAEFEKETLQAPSGHIAYQIFIKGLKGGHSGIDITLARGNANVLLARLLAKLLKKFDVTIANFNGGDMRNAIPRESSALITVDALQATDFLVFVKKFFKAYEIEFKGIDDGLTISCLQTKIPEEVLAAGFCHEFLKAVTCCPNGVIHLEAHMPGVVQTSTNLSVVETTEQAIKVHCLLRSSSLVEKNKLAMVMTNLFQLFGAKVRTYGDYPGWTPSPSSEILAVTKDVFRRVMRREPEVKVIHAGLECGIIGNSHQKLDMISFGPNILHPHSPDERVQIESVQKYWKLLQEVLMQIPIISTAE